MLLPGTTQKLPGSLGSPWLEGNKAGLPVLIYAAPTCKKSKPTKQVQLLTQVISNRAKARASLNKDNGLPCGGNGRVLMTVDAGELLLRVANNNTWLNPLHFCNKRLL